MATARTWVRRQGKISRSGTSRGRMLSLSKLASRSSSDKASGCSAPQAARCYIASSARVSPAFTSPASTFNPGCVPAMVAAGSMAMTTALPSSPS